NDDSALRPAHVGKRVVFVVDTFELEVARLPAEIGNACFTQCHCKSSVLVASTPHLTPSCGPGGGCPGEPKRGVPLSKQCHAGQANQCQSVPRERSEICAASGRPSLDRV